MLCAELSCPTQLADLLYDMFQRRKLEGDWQGINLRQALESALITNQRDSRLQAVWHEMLTQRRHEFLTGDEYAGFEGIRLMPTSEATRGEPALDAIGAALAAIATRLEPGATAAWNFTVSLTVSFARIPEDQPGTAIWWSRRIEIIGRGGRSNAFRDFLLHKRLSTRLMSIIARLSGITFSLVYLRYTSIRFWQSTAMVMFWKSLCLRQLFISFNLSLLYLNATGF